MGLGVEQIDAGTTLRLWLAQGANSIGYGSSWQKCWARDGFGGQVKSGRRSADCVTSANSRHRFSKFYSFFFFAFAFALVHSWAAASILMCALIPPHGSLQTKQKKSGRYHLQPKVGFHRSLFPRKASVHRIVELTVQPVPLSRVLLSHAINMAKHRMS